MASSKTAIARPALRRVGSLIVPSACLTAVPYVAEVHSPLTPTMHFCDQTASDRHGLVALTLVPALGTRVFSCFLVARRYLRWPLHPLISEITPPTGRRQPVRPPSAEMRPFAPRSESAGAVPRSDLGWVDRTGVRAVEM